MTGLRENTPLYNYYFLNDNSYVILNIRVSTFFFRSPDKGYCVSHYILDMVK